MCTDERGISVIFIMPFGENTLPSKTYFIISRFLKSIFHSEELKLSVLCLETQLTNTGVKRLALQKMNIEHFHCGACAPRQSDPSNLTIAA